jgi:hypothetical protein
MLWILKALTLPIIRIRNTLLTKEIPTRSVDGAIATHCLQERVRGELPVYLSSPLSYCREGLSCIKKPVGYS